MSKAASNPIGHARDASKGSGGGGWMSRFKAQLAEAIAAVAAPAPEAEAAAAEAPAPKQFETRDAIGNGLFRKAAGDKAALVGDNRAKSAARKRLLGE